MTKILPLSFTESSRSVLCFILSVANWICILTSLGLIFVGAYVKLYIEQYTILVENYDGNTFPFLVIGVGLLSLCLNIASGFLFYMSTFPDKRTALQYFLLVYIVVQCLIAFVVLAGGVMCYIHINHIEDTFRDGIALSMKRYREEGHIKLEIDLLQSEFHCCGNRGYTDWFSIDWIQDKFKKDFAYNEPVVFVDEGVTYEPGITRAVFHHDHVPASCCDYNHTRPCIHTDVHDNQRHVEYNYRTHITLYKIGCVEALMNYVGDQILANASIGMFALFIVQLILALLTRFLQTSVTEALTTGNPAASSDGFLLKFGKEVPKEKKEDGEGEEEEEEEEKEGGEEQPLLNEGDAPLATPGFEQRHSQHGSLRRSSRLLARQGSTGPNRDAALYGQGVYSRHSAIMSPTQHHPAAYDQPIYDRTDQGIYGMDQQNMYGMDQQNMYEMDQQNMYGTGLPPGVPPPPPPPPLPKFK